MLIIDALRDLINDSNLSYETKGIGKMTDFKVVNITLKDGITSISLPESVRKYIYRIDTGNAVASIPTASMPCGKYVSILFSRINAPEYDLIDDAEASEFLSQVFILHQALPYFWNAFDLEILSEDFEAPEGLFDYDKDFSSNAFISKPEFNLSTFKVAPKVFSSMEGMINFPPAYDAYGNAGVIWEPFINCPNITKISSQGVLTESVRRVYAMNLTTYDEDDGYGYRKPNYSAYPSGGNPQVLGQVVSTEDVWNFEDPPAIPIFGNERLEVWSDMIKPSMIKIGWKAAFGTPLSLPFFDPNTAPKLKTFKMSLPEIFFNQDLDVTSFTYGMELMGIKEISPNIEAAGIYEIKRHVRNALVGESTRLCPYVLSRQFEQVSYTFDKALKDLYGDESIQLKVPEVGANITAIDSYYSCSVYYGGEPLANPDATVLYSTSCDGTWDEPEPLIIPKIPEGVKQVSRYLDGTFQWSAIGPNVSPSIEVPDEFPKIWDNIVVIPALPSSIELLGSYLNLTFSSTVGSRKFYTNILQDSLLDLAIKNYWSEEAGIYRQRIQRPYDQASDSDYIDSIGFGLTPLSVYTDVDLEQIISFNIDDGILFEENICPNLIKIGEWQTECFQSSWINPEAFTIILPIPPSADVDGAYIRTLDIFDRAMIEYDLIVNANPPLSPYPKTYATTAWVEGEDPTEYMELDDLYVKRKGQQMFDINKVSNIQLTSSYNQGDPFLTIGSYNDSWYGDTSVNGVGEIDVDADDNPFISAHLFGNGGESFYDINVSPPSNLKPYFDSHPELKRWLY